MKAVRLPDGFQLVALARPHRRKDFRSGQDAVDRHLRERALQTQGKRLSSTRVLVESASGIVAGYYTLAMGQVGFAELPLAEEKKLPRRELPVAVLAWLGVDLGFQNRGLGERLLAVALRECWEASRTFAFVAVVLDCLDEATKGFYRRWDFREVPAHPLRLFLSARELESLMSETGA